MILKFRDFCRMLFPLARIQKMRDKDKQNYHITLRDITRDEVYSVFESKGFSIGTSTRTHSTAYTGNTILFENETVHFVVRDRNTNAKHFMRRKEVTPDAIGLGGQTFTDPALLKQATQQGLLNCTTKENTQALMSILNNIDGTGSFENVEILATDKSRITSDFGEVASAYARTLQGQTVEFPSRSNFEGIDFFANGVGVSAKGDRGSSRLSLVDYKDIIEKFGNSHTEKLLKALANREIYQVLDIASEQSPELHYWSKRLEFSQAGLVTYVNDKTYDDYVQDILNCQGGARLGLPQKEQQCRVYWKERDHNPLLFTLLTLLDRYYSEQNIKDISQFVRKIFVGSNIEFEYFDYNIDSNTIDINILPIVQYTVWKINYWGNAASALNNWPAVKGIK